MYQPPGRLYHSVTIVTGSSEVSPGPGRQLRPTVGLWSRHEPQGDDDQVGLFPPGGLGEVQIPYERNDDSLDHRKMSIGECRRRERSSGRIGFLRRNGFSYGEGFLSSVSH